MKWIYLIKFCFYGLFGIWNISVKNYVWASGWFLLSIMMLSFYTIQEIKEKK